MTTKTLLKAAGKIAAFLLILPCVFLVTLFAVPKIQYHAGLRGRAFDAAAWKAEAGKSGLDASPRRPMVRSLTKNHLRVGMTRGNVVEILGEPRGVYGPQVMDYWLGGPGGFALDHDIIEIFLDDHGRVTHWRVRNT